MTDYPNTIDGDADYWGLTGRTRTWYTHRASNHAFQLATARDLQHTRRHIRASSNRRIVAKLIMMPPLAILGNVAGFLFQNSHADRGVAVLIASVCVAVAWFLMQDWR